MESLKDRWKAKTPDFWKKVQKVGIIAGILGGALLTAPISLPVSIVTGAGYLVAIGTATATLSQLTKE
jgi:ABC-type xylose transport system permease subunit